MIFDPAGCGTLCLFGGPALPPTTTLRRSVQDTIYDPYIPHLSLFKRPLRCTPTSSLCVRAAMLLYSARQPPMQPLHTHIGHDHRRPQPCQSHRIGLKSQSCLSQTLGQAPARTRVARWHTWVAHERGWVVQRCFVCVHSASPPLQRAQRGRLMHANSTVPLVVWQLCSLSLSTRPEPLLLRPTRFPAVVVSTRNQTARRGPIDLLLRALIDGNHTNTRHVC